VGCCSKQLWFELVLECFDSSKSAWKRMAKRNHVAEAGGKNAVRAKNVTYKAWI